MKSAVVAALTPVPVKKPRSAVRTVIATLMTFAQTSGFFDDCDVDIG